MGMSDPAFQPTCRSGGLTNSFSEILSPPVKSPRSQWPSPLFGSAQAFHHFPNANRGSQVGENCLSLLLQGEKKVPAEVKRN